MKFCFEEFYYYDNDEIANETDDLNKNSKSDWNSSVFKF